MDDLYILCNSPSLFVLVKHNRIGAELFTSLNNDLSPLYPVESRSDVDGFTFTRKQIPMSPGFAITDFKSQGRSIDKVIIDIKIAQRKTPISSSLVNHKIYTSLNVQLGRIRSCHGTNLHVMGLPRD